MFNKHLPVRLAIGLLFCASLFCLGCAAGYYDYPCGCVPYGYHSLPPLPYPTYSACPTPKAAWFFSQRAAAAPAELVESTDAGEPD